MGNSTRFVAIALSIAVALISTNPAFSTDNPVPSDQRQVVENSDWFPWSSIDAAVRWVYGAEFKAEVGYPLTQPAIKDMKKKTFCSELDDQCLASATQIEVVGNSPFCTGMEIVSNCIESLRFYSPSSGWVDAEFLRTWDLTVSQRRIDEFLAEPGPHISEVLEINKSHGWSENEKLNFPGSANGPSLFSRTNPDSGAVEYFIVQANWFTLLQVKNKQINSFDYVDFDVSVTPVEIMTADCARPQIEHVSKSITGSVDFSGSHTGCVEGAHYPKDGEIAFAKRFVKDMRVQLSFKVSSKVGGWFRSRLSDPTINLEPISSHLNRMVVEGNSAQIPITNVYFDATDPILKSILTPSELESIEKTLEADPNFSGSSAGGGSRLSDMRPWMKYLNPTAKGEVDSWRLSKLSVGSVGSQRCLSRTDRIEGFINTNAMVYQQEIPQFKNGYLNYQVGGVHYSMKGAVNLGEYDLQIRSETARCLYGFSKAPVSATVQVVGEQGSENIATTIVSEKDGWLKLAAYGFTFSEKEIKVKLTQPYSKTLTKFAGSTKTLTSRQKAEIKATVTKAKNNPKFICTGTYVAATSKSTALARAKATCNYANSLDKSHSYFAQAKQTSAKSYDAKVMITSK